MKHCDKHGKDYDDRALGCVKCMTDIAFCGKHNIHYNASLWKCHRCPSKYQVEITGLLAKIEHWKNAWHEQREVTGVAAWEVPNPFYLRVVNALYEQRQYRKFIEYAKRLMREKPEDFKDE